MPEPARNGPSVPEVSGPAGGVRGCPEVLPDIRRALLSSSRLQTDQALRVLWLLSKPELKLAAVQSAYPHPVRDAAKRMLREP